MARMVRKQIYVEPHQEEALKSRARELKLSEAELIRQGVDLALAQGISSPIDTKAWEAELTFIEERAKISALDGKRTWTREELYEDRLSG